jgi:hypothetical protein
VHIDEAKLHPAGLLAMQYAAALSGLVQMPPKTQYCLVPQFAARTVCGDKTLSAAAPQQMIAATI